LDNLLQVIDLVVHFSTDYGVVQALDSCCLEIKKGEILGLIGESGCGKSTVAKAILGVIPVPPGKILHGRILFRGEDLLQMEPKKLNSSVRGRAITIVPQDPYSSFNPVFTIGTQIMDILKWKVERDAGPSSSRPVTPDRERVIDLLKELQIPTPHSQLSKYPYQLSGGQRQRIMIAMALLTNPSLIIADEPTTALDVTIEAQILRLLRQLVHHYGVSVLFITHDLAVASQICDRVVVMYAGQEVEVAPISSFFERPCHPYTKKLLESLPNPRGEIRDIPGEVPSLIGRLPGCRFESRCDFASGKCKEERPLAEEIFPGHWIRCFNPLVRG
jgi:peptide/nickel transport system ATP-binding protein